LASSSQRESTVPSAAEWVSELQNPRASKAEWQDFEWDNEDATKTNIVVKPLKLLDASLSAHDALRRYTVCREVPYGGLPDVHLALLEGAAGFRRTVAVQRLRHEPGSAEPTPGLSPDALLGCHVRHPNVIPVLDLIQVEGEFLLVMEYVISETLAQLRAQGNRPPIPISVAIASGILHALDAAHSARDAFDSPLEIVHAGVAPDTVLVGVDGITRLIHFGLSKKSRATAPGRSLLKGKPGYFAPEQVFDRRVDARTDVFAAGVLLWESLAGRPLLEGDGPVDCMMRFLSRGTRPPSEVNPQVSDRLDAVLARALEPAPERRYQTAAEFAEALEAAVEPATRAEVSRYVEGLAWVSIREQRALLNDTRPEDDAPRAARASDPKPDLGMPEDLDDPTLIPGSVPYLNAGSDLVSHWAARRPDEPTAVENRRVPTPPAPASTPTAVAMPMPIPALSPLPRAPDEPPRARVPSDPREFPSAPRITPVPALQAHVSSRAPQSFNQPAPKAPKAWFWPGVVLTIGLACALTLQLHPRARREIRQLFSVTETRPAPAASVVAPPSVALPVSAPSVAPVPPLAAIPSEAPKSSERVLRLDELPLQREAEQTEPEAKPEAKPRTKKPVKKLRRRPAASTAASTAPSAEPPITLDE
jgi:serine/threonine-protein kinase